jgi:hypothetical protein
MEDGVGDRAGPAGEPLGVGLELVPSLDEAAGLAVTDGHREVRADEDEGSPSSMISTGSRIEPA